MLRAGFRTFLAVFFIAAGINHFRMPEVYLAMIPPWLPWHAALNWSSGAAEIAGGIGLFPSATRRAAGWGLVALLIAVFPANLHCAMTGTLPGFHVAPWILWVRLPFQGLFIAAVYGCAGLGRPRS
jgi:uncharacterized membrane protein